MAMMMVGRLKMRAMTVIFAAFAGIAKRLKYGK